MGTSKLSHRRFYCFDTKNCLAVEYLQVTLSVMTSALDPRLGAMAGLVATQASVAPLSRTAGVSCRNDTDVRVVLIQVCWVIFIIIILLMPHCCGAGLLMD
jgi:hypothetical protein